MIIFALGLLLGSILSASGAWLLSGFFAFVPAWAKSSLLLLAASFAVARDNGILRTPLPQLSRQVPRSIFTRGPWIASLQFGFEMGTGFLTYVTSTVPYLLLVAIIVSGTPYVLALLAGVGFGLGRAVVPYLRLASNQGERWDNLVPCRESVLVRCCSGVAFGLILLTLPFFG